MVGFFMFVILVVLGVLVLVAGRQWLDPGRRTVEGAAPSSEQLDRVESALTTLESRLDDLQEQQRFLERLVAERPERPSLPGRGAAEGEGTDTGSILFDTEPSEEDR